jgi:hypothetical protein
VWGKTNVVSLQSSLICTLDAAGTQLDAANVSTDFRDVLVVMGTVQLTTDGVATLNCRAGTTGGISAVGVEQVHLAAIAVDSLN